jgi:hypothetical protein
MKVRRHAHVKLGRRRDTCGCFAVSIGPRGGDGIYRRSIELNPNYPASSRHVDGGVEIVRIKRHCTLKETTRALVIAGCWPFDDCEAANPSDAVVQ